MWCSWTASDSGQYVGSARGSTYYDYLVIALFKGDALGTLTAVRTNAPASRVAFEAVAGRTYQLVVDTATNATTDFALRLGPAPPNDSFSNRIFLAGTAVVAAGASVNATCTVPEDGGPSGNSVWWAWTAPADGLVHASLALAETNLAPTLALFVEMPGVSATNAARSASSVTPTNLVSTTFGVTSGCVYDLRVTTAFGDSTNIVLSLDFEPQPGFDGSWANAGCNWVRGGDALWLLQANVVHDPPDALQAGPLLNTGPGANSSFPTTDPRFAWIQATFPGPGTLQFWWKASADARDQLTCDLLAYPTPPGRVIQVLPSDWVQKSVSLPDRTNVVRWTFYRYSLRNVGQSSAWLDGITLELRPPSPFTLSYLRLATNGVWKLGFSGQAQRFYHVQSSTNLLEWAEITNVFCRVNGSLSVSLPMDTNAPLLFLRAVAE